MAGQGAGGEAPGEAAGANLRAWRAAAPLYPLRGPLLARCDGCGATCDLEDDGTVVTQDDEVVCAACARAPYATEEA